MTLEYLLIQGVGLVGTALYFVSFQCRRNRRLFQVQFVSYLCYAIHLLLLGAVTGGLSCTVNLIRSLCLSTRWKFARSRAMCAILCAMQLAALFFSWNGWISLLPIVANIAQTIGGYTHNARKIRLTGLLINSPLWIIYDVIVGSWAGILDEAVSDISMIISIIRYGWKNLDRNDEGLS